MENSKINELLGDITANENVGKQLLMLYGQINQEVIISTIKLTERKLILEKVPGNLITKTKIICTEMLQNILKHQTKHATHLPNFIIRLTDEGLSIVSTNVVTEADKNHISSQLDIFSRINKEDFRDFYMESFKGASITTSGNAGLGLLDIVYRSKQSVRYKMEQISSDLFSFHLDVTISHPIVLSAN